MRKLSAALVAAAAIFFGLWFAQPAHAEGTTPIAAACLPGWYVNAEDEGDRLPDPTEAGLVFEETDLAHHATDIPLALLEPGSYAASPDPDQPSFFSVEVRNASGAYGTLRWDGAKWSITIGAGNGATDGAFEGADPVALLAGKVTKWGAFDAADIHVVSFGVGYTQNPPGTVKTTVTSVTFAGHTYDMTCKPPASASPSASASVSTTTAPPPSPATTTAGPVNPTATTTPVALPVTGDSTGKIATAGIGVFLAGAALLAGVIISAARRRRRITAGK